MNIKRICCLAILFCFASYSSKVSFTEQVQTDEIISKNRIVSEYQIKEIEDTIKNIGFNKLQLYHIKNSYNNTTENNEINSISKATKLQNEIRLNEERLLELGAERTSAALLEHFIFQTTDTKPENNILLQLNSWDPSVIISQFMDAYDIWGYTMDYLGYTQYHIIFQSNGSDPYLYHNQRYTAYGKFEAGSSEAYKWVNDIISIYAEKLVGGGIEKLHPMLIFLPYELLFSVKPSPTEVKSQGIATFLNQSLLITQKFVYTYNTSTNQWDYSLSTNRVQNLVDITSEVIKNGTLYREPTYFNDMSDGDYYNAGRDAYTAFLGKNSINTCQNMIVVHSSSKFSNIKHFYLITPNGPGHMVYFP